MYPNNTQCLHLDQQSAQRPNVERRIESDACTVLNTRPGLKQAHETTALLRPMEEKPTRKLLPAWLRRKRGIALLAGGAILVILAIILAVLGGTGKLTGNAEHHDDGEFRGISGVPEDGGRLKTQEYLSCFTENKLLSPPWYPTPRGGTLQSWEDSYSKARKLVEEMSLVEKVNLTTGVGWQMGLCVGNTGPATSAGFPSLCFQDGPLGLRSVDNVTAFPAGVTVAATWDRGLIRKRGRALGQEARIKGVNVILGPAMGPIGSLPAGGRNWEAFGSDPVLQGVASSETIRGVQEEGVIATAKHYVLNEQEHFRMPEEWGIPNAMTSNIDDRTLHEVFIWPFAESVRAGVASVMCSYQMINSSYGCSNSLLMNGILKDELGFQGFVQSDWYAQYNGVASALAGLDVSMPGNGPRSGHGTSYWGSNLTLAALNTSVPMERLNDMTTRLVAAWYQLEQDSWPKPPPEDDGGPSFSSWTDDEMGFLHPGSGDDEEKVVVNKFIDARGEGDDAHSEIARKVAAEGTVLLKNENAFLPLSRDGSSPTGDAEKYRIGVFGEDAGPEESPNSCNGICDQGTLVSGWGSGAVDSPYIMTPWKALKESFNNESVAIASYLTNNVTGTDMADQNLCFAFANANSGEGFSSVGDLHGDRNDLFLQNDTDQLIQEVADNCGNGIGDTIVVIHSVGPVLVESWIEHPGVKAVLLANLPGEESGNSLVDVLFGDLDASGRLPYTIGKTLEDYGQHSHVLYEAHEPVPQKNFSLGLYMDHRHFDEQDISPRFEFGFGLSYTTFNMSNLVITPLQEKSALPATRPEPDASPPSYDNTIPAPESALFPEGFRALSQYLYPYINSADQVETGDYDYPDGYDKVQEPSPAGGGEGGNPSLYESVVNVSVDVQNTGSRTGKEVVQLYLSFPDNVTDATDETGNAATSMIDFPPRMLRNFQKVDIAPGRSTTVEMSLTRKDLSFWSTIRQNWVMPVDGQFTIWVGRSSRVLPLWGEF